ncbi:MAG: pyridoxal phosphate-dependent aminotransferase [Candidatus Aerophobetes bacterium]|nr:pyridoxal phosphate-dependent aminotransferase [Candidatus Aerophobetes bacterium]
MKNLSERAAKVGISLTTAINTRTKQMIKEGKRVINFGIGEPDFDTPLEIREAGIKAIKDGFTRYTPASGIPELKKAVCEKFKNENNIAYSPSQVVVTVGAKQAIYNAIQTICTPNDEVIIPLPYWVSYPDQVKLAGAVPIFLSTQEDKAFKINPKDLEKKITSKTKILIINYPNNPSGAVYNREELEEIASLVVNYDIYLISDEINEKLTYEGNHISIASLGDEIKQRTITVNAVSKTYCMTGWRIGYAGGREEIIQVMGKIQSHSTSGANSIAQTAAISALRGPQEGVEERKKIFQQRRNLMVDKLNQIEGIRCLLPSGAFYVFPNISHFFGKGWKDWQINNSMDLSEYFLEEQGVAVTPGSAFGCDEYVRLVYAISLQDIEEGVDKIKEGLERLK